MHDRRSFDPDAAADLRRRKRRDLSDHLLLRAEWLEPSERALVEAVYRDGRSAIELAALAGRTPRSMRRRLRRIVRRVLAPEFVFVAQRRSRWTASRRRVADACILHGRSMREAATELGLTLHTIRRHMEAIRAQIESQIESQLESQIESQHESQHAGGPEPRPRAADRRCAVRGRVA